jgi:hypothetical protein
MSSNSGWRGLNIVEIILALSVIAGLMFVTVRVQTAGLRGSSAQASDTPVVVRSDVSAIDPEVSTTRTP